MRERIIIAIDPDIDKNGVATLFVHTREIRLESMSFAPLLDYIKEQYQQQTEAGVKIEIVIEAGWVNSGNYHLVPYDTKYSAAKKGVDQGRNHQRGIDIHEYCLYHNIPVALIKPLAKMWKGKDRKITHEELASYMRVNKKRSNQEERDAALLAWIYAGLPLRIVT